MFDNKMTMPVLILSMTLVLMTAFQARQLQMDRANLRDAFAKQDQQLQQAQQVTAQFQAIAIDTAKLAADGDQTAQKVVDDLKKIGIVVKPDGTNNLTPAGDKPTDAAANAAVNAAAPAPAKPAAK